MLLYGAPSRAPDSWQRLLVAGCFALSPHVIVQPKTAARLQSFAGGAPGLRGPRALVLRSFVAGL